MFDLNLLKGIEDKAAASIRINEGDYIGEDGLLYCGKCHTRKQAKVSFIEGRHPMCLCKCESEKRNAEMERAKLAEQIQRNKDNCFDVCMDKQENGVMAEWTFENDKGYSKKAITAARNYAEKFETFKEKKQGILFFGEKGVGKTYATACIANYLLDRGYWVKMTNFTRIENKLFNAYDKQSIYDSLNMCDLLILDDLGVERRSEYMQEIVYNIIDNRYRIGKPLLVTTNLTSKELKNAEDVAHQRIYSRLFEMCFPLEVIGEDLRERKLKENHQEVKGLLGI